MVGSRAARAGAYRGLCSHRTSDTSSTRRPTASPRASQVDFFCSFDPNANGRVLFGVRPQNTRTITMPDLCGAASVAGCSESRLTEVGKYVVSKHIQHPTITTTTKNVSLSLTGPVRRYEYQKLAERGIGKPRRGCCVCGLRLHLLHAWTA